MPKIPQAGLSRRQTAPFISVPPSAPSSSLADAQVGEAVSNAAFEIADFAIKKLERKREDDINFLISSEAIKVSPALRKIQNDLEREAKKEDKPFDSVKYRDAQEAYKQSRLENIVDDDARKAVSIAIDRRGVRFVERAVNLTAADNERFRLDSLDDLEENAIEGFVAGPLDFLTTLDEKGRDVPDPNKIKGVLLDHMWNLSSSGLSPSTIQDRQEDFTKRSMDLFLRRFFIEGTPQQIKGIMQQLQEGVYSDVYNDPKKITSLMKEARAAFGLREDLVSRESRAQRSSDRRNLNKTREEMVIDHMFKGFTTIPSPDLEELVKNKTITKEEAKLFKVTIEASQTAFTARKESINQPNSVVVQKIAELTAERDKAAETSGEEAANKRIALDMALHGVINPATNKREGGLLLMLAKRSTDGGQSFLDENQGLVQKNISDVQTIINSPESDADKNESLIEMRNQFLEKQREYNINVLGKSPEGKMIYLTNDQAKSLNTFFNGGASAQDKDKEINKLLAQFPGDSIVDALLQLKSVDNKLDRDVEELIRFKLGDVPEGDLADWRNMMNLKLKGSLVSELSRRLDESQVLEPDSKAAAINQSLVEKINEAYRPFSEAFRERLSLEVDRRKSLIDYSLYQLMINNKDFTEDSQISAVKKAMDDLLNRTHLVVDMKGSMSGSTAVSKEFLREKGLGDDGREYRAMILDAVFSLRPPDVMRSPGTGITEKAQRVKTINIIQANNIQVSPGPKEEVISIKITDGGQLRTLLLADGKTPFVISFTPEAVAVFRSKWSGVSDKERDEILSDHDDHRDFTVKKSKSRKQEDLKDAIILPGVPTRKEREASRKAAEQAIEKEFEERALGGIRD